MFAYAALLFAGFYATQVVAVQPADLAFGREQVEKFIHDRPDAGAVINRNPALKEQLAILFADDGQGVNGRAGHVHWDKEEPRSPYSECSQARDGKPSSVRVTSWSKVTPTDKCACLVFELHNVWNGRSASAFCLMALRKEIS